MGRVERRTEGGYLLVDMYKILNNKEKLLLKIVLKHIIHFSIYKAMECNFEIETDLVCGRSWVPSPLLE